MLVILGVGLGLVFLVHLGLGLRVALRLGFGLGLVPDLIRLLLGYTHASLDLILWNYELTRLCITGAVDGMGEDAHTAGEGRGLYLIANIDFWLFH